MTEYWCLGQREAQERLPHTSPKPSCAGSKGQPTLGGGRLGDKWCSLGYTLLLQYQLGRTDISLMHF
jgi:hypothetical protein